jgi:ABC-type multidrug transport system fused ATPase/permease subunit
MLNFTAAQRWLGLRIEFLGASILLAVAVIVACTNGHLKIPPSLVGLLIMWAVIFSAALNFFFLRFTDSEARITSIERIQRASELPQEAEWSNDESNKLDPRWPSTGDLVFDSVCLRYRKDLSLALDSVSFHLPPSTRCGVVGRTGSGKTSLTAALFRIVEVESGKICLDGVDLSTIGLADVRGRQGGMRVIPQDPVLFAGTLRDCIDPFHTDSDEMIFKALQAVNFQGSQNRGISILKDLVEESGSNFSVGERQLLCLARAIVEEPRVLVLDEATASVDHETDTALQAMLRVKFEKSTLLTIAHRLQTIMDYDVVLVMDDGHAAEFGPPHELLQKTNSVFTSLVEATGSESSLELRRIAAETYSKKSLSDDTHCQ